MKKSEKMGEKKSYKAAGSASEKKSYKAAGSIGETGKFSKTMGSFGVDKNEQQVDISKNKSLQGAPLGKKQCMVAFGSPNFRLSDLAG